MAGESGAGGTFVGAGGAFVSLFADTAWLSANRLACPSASVPTPRVRNTLCALEMCSVPDEQQRCSRRAQLARIALAAGGVLACADAAPVFAEKKQKLSGGLVGENPNAAQDLFTAKFQSGLNKRTNRLFGCQTQTNCVSTAAGKNPTQFVAPWDFTTKTSDPEKAWEALKDVLDNDASLKVIEVDDERMYLRATGKSKVPKDGVDDVEFLMVPEEKIVTTRSASRGNFYVYPYQVPIGDGGYQKQRLQGILSQLGWVELNYNGNGVFTDGCGANGDKKCSDFWDKL